MVVLWVLVGFVVVWIVLFVVARRRGNQDLPLSRAVRRQQIEDASKIDPPGQTPGNQVSGAGWPGGF